VEVRSFCQFLHRRQSLGKEVLRFRYVVPQHVRGRPTVHVSDDDRSDTEPTPGGLRTPTPRQSSSPLKMKARRFGGHHIIFSSECVLHLLLT
jgi:hypothetical protein